MRSIKPPPFPKVVSLSFGRFQGQADQTDPAVQPISLLREMRNLRLDNAVLSVRPGLTGEFTFDSVDAGTGIGHWRKPPTAIAEEEKHILVHGTRNEILSDGSTQKRGALYVEVGDGYGAYDITPTLSDLTSALSLPTHPKRTFFAAFNEREYFSDGWNGLGRWDGGDPATTTARLVRAVTPPAASFATAVVTVLPQPGHGSPWATSNGGTLPITMVTESNPVGGGTGNVGAPAAAANGEYLYSDFDAGFPSDFTEGDPSRCTDAFLLCLQVQNVGAADVFKDGAVLSFEFWVGPGDPAVSLAGGHSWPFTVTSTGWMFFYFPTNGVAASLLSAVRYVAVQVLDDRGGGVYTFDIAEVFAPGRQGTPGTNNDIYYKLIATDSVTGVRSVDTAGTIQFGVPLVVPTPGAASAAVNLPAYPRQRTQVTLDFNATGGDSISVYRAILEDFVSDPEGLTYRLVKTVLRTDANPTTLLYTFYDNVSEAELLAATDLPWPEDVPLTEANAPQFLVSKDTRLLLAKSDNHKSRVWASDIGVGESVPQTAFNDNPNAGQGGYVDVGHDDGDEIMGMGLWGHEVLIWKRRAVWVWTFESEGATFEKWSIPRLTEPGTVAPLSLCRLPTAWVWFSGDGLYLLQDGTDTATELPITYSIQKTIDEIPIDMREKVACGYDPVQDLLFVAVAEDGFTENSKLLVLDRRLRSDTAPYGQWSGAWDVRDMGGQPLERWQPRQMHYDGDQMLFLRGDTSAVDRFKRMGVDLVPWNDYEKPIQCALQTGWLTLSLDGISSTPDRLTRIVERSLRFTFDGAENGDAKAFVSANLTLETRPPGARHVYSYNYTVDPLLSSPNGLFASGAASEGSRQCHNDLQGQEFRIGMDWTCNANAPVRFLGGTLKLMDRGSWRG